MRWFLIALTAAVLAACGEQAAAPDGPTYGERLKAEAQQPGNWMLHGRTYDEQRFSPLGQITRANVADLELAWSYEFDTRRGQEATPIVVDGIMYTTSAWSKVQALDVRTGEELWQYDPEVPGKWAVRGCCDVVNRGAAFWDGKVISATFDGRLIALNAKSGDLVWSVDTIVDRSKNYTITGAPRIVKGKVIIGNGGGEYGVRGYITAYDAQTGAQIWRFYTVPGDPSKPFENPILEMAAKTWSGEWWTYGGGGTVWDSMAYDADLDLLYIGVGNGSPWNPDVRSPGGGDNLFVSSIVALRPDTGEYVWHYQTTPGDQWDFTATQHMVLADLSIDGQDRKVLMQAPKNGFFYVLDRATGELISAENYVPVTWANGVDQKTGRPDIVDAAYYHKTGKAWEGMPGPMGGHNWHPMSFSPETGLVYIPAQINGFPYVADEDFKYKKLAVNLGIDLGAAALPSDQAIRDQVRKSLNGILMAWDPVSQKEVWRAEHGGLWNGGVLSTAGGLVFQGNRNGYFAAYDAETGETLWQRDAQTGVVAAPISFSVDGEQYVAVVAGWGGIVPLLLGELSHTDEGPQVNRSRVLVYKLGGKAKLPLKEPIIRAKSEAPEPFGTKAQLASGFQNYARFCSGCHGDTAVSGGVLPDLRYSASLSDQDTWFLIVRDGGLEDLGMVGFAEELSEDDMTAIRAYIVQRAHESGATRAGEKG